MSTMTIEGIEVRIAESNEYPRVLWRGNNNIISPLAANEVNSVNNNDIGIYVKQSGKYYFVPKYVPQQQTSSNAKIMGMVLAEEGGGSGTWVRINENYETINFDPTFKTYANMRQVTDSTYGEFTEIPITYVKTETIASGTYQGKTCYWIADGPVQGFHIHPAFIGQDGQPHNLKIANWIASNKNNVPYSEDKGIEYDGYWTNIGFKTLHSKKWMSGNARLYNIYDHHFLARMVLTEFGTPNTNNNASLKTLINNKSRSIYRGIYDIAGGENIVNVLLYGCHGYGDNGIYVLSQDGLLNLVNVGRFVIYDNVNEHRPRRCCINTVNNVDLGDLFLGQFMTSYSNGSFACSQHVGAEAITTYGGINDVNMFENTYANYDDAGKTTWEDLADYVDTTNSGDPFIGFRISICG